MSEIWPYGFSLIGDVTFQSAAYVARYIMKKVTGDLAKDHYEYIDPDTGEIINLKPEYTTMSRRPGLGKGWFEKYKSDVYPDDFVILNGKKMKPPKYYDRQYEIDDPKLFQKTKSSRVSKSRQHVDNNTPDRLKIRESVQLSRLCLLPRPLDSED